MHIYKWLFVLFNKYILYWLLNKLYYLLNTYLVNNTNIKLCMSNLVGKLKIYLLYENARNGKLHELSEVGPFVHICTVHTIVLFQSLVGVYRRTQHVKYCYEHTISATCFGLHCSHLQAVCMEHTWRASICIFLIQFSLLHLQIAQFKCWRQDPSLSTVTKLQAATPSNHGWKGNIFFFLSSASTSAMRPCSLLFNRNRSLFTRR
jgi:hypothetical protein